MHDQQLKDSFIEFTCLQDYIDYQKPFFIGDYYWELVSRKKQLGFSPKDLFEWQSLESLIRYVEDELDVEI